MPFFDLVCRAMNYKMWFTYKSLSNYINVHMKSNDGKKVTVELDPKWNIKFIKEFVGPKLGFQGDNIKIIFAGKELDDSITIADCELGDQSTVYCISLGKIQESTTCFKKIPIDLPEEEVGSFYVACSHCKGVRQGKIRVRCAECKSGAITVDKDPTSWYDVLNPRIISGHCVETGCCTSAVSWCEFYFRCKDHVSENDTVVPLPLIRANTRSVPCLACLEVATTVIVFDCIENHTICLDCFSTFVESRLRERGFILSAEHGYTLPCPVGCEGFFIQEPHHFRILPEPMYAQYQRFAAEECLLADGGVICPRADCGAGIFPDPDSNRVVCSLLGCGNIFCKLCHEEYHSGDCNTETLDRLGVLPYTVDPVHAAQARWNKASRDTIRESTNPCPKCKVRTERDGGCMHIICSRCTFEWCWICQSEWNRNCRAIHWFG